MSVISHVEEFTLRITPSVVTVYKWCASEIRLFLTINYTIKTNTTIPLVTKSIESGDETVNNFNMKANTEVTRVLIQTNLEKISISNTIVNKMLTQTVDHVILNSYIEKSKENADAGQVQK
ncbi:hypothetical protein EIN_435680 [Entamoeba invadens IP1]|uniref:Uncharacterized protein n=1 Tax=Entamoeba invadens IP1 TaxID=370355 RepID=A0A0A1U6V6_ENTIV|nr:hypothetical protein EIN_435680 [Entamoeba invadens IP1]ELP88632.1 hypothetical protein EIN_435680 [Entamoeba invadens IP1]|eukprot:XP_004255403.1 hypothetical protein EIN_435680 [Entamoeba invadens IP1]